MTSDMEKILTGKKIEGIKALFYKIKGGHNLRTDVMEGEYLAKPEVGKGFRIFGKGLKRGLRMIYTSDVERIEPTEGGFILHTVTGSVYGIQNDPK